MATKYLIGGSDVTASGPLVLKSQIFEEYPELLSQVKTAGLWLQGDNTYGQLGDNTVTWRSSPVQTIAKGTVWKDIAAGNHVTAGLKTDGSLWAWGYSGSLLGNGETSTSSTGRRSSPVQVVAQSSQQWKYLIAPTSTIAGIRLDGSLWMWGAGNLGTLGDGTTVGKSSPVQTVAGGTDWSYITGGDRFFCAIKTNGTVWTWGRNPNGQLGDGTTVDKSSPVQEMTGSTDWKQVFCGASHTIAIKNGGTLWAWGSNSSGQLGDGTTVSRSSPVQTVAGGTNWNSVPVGGNWNTTTSSAIKTDGTLWLWGSGGSGILGNNSTTSRSSPVQTVAGGTTWKQVTIGIGHHAAIKTDGSLWTWGSNSDRNLGDGTTVNKSSPVQTTAGGTDWATVYATGSSGNHAIKTDGTLWVWGRSYTSSGQSLGLSGSAGYVSSPTQQRFGTNTWVSAVGGRYVGIGIRTNGTPWFWGELSTAATDITAVPGSTPVVRHMPTPFLTERWNSATSIVCGAGASASNTNKTAFATIRSDGTLWTWGANDKGQLGHGDSRTDARPFPNQTVAEGNDWSSVYVGGTHMIGIKTNGTMWSWGDNSVGQLGHSLTSQNASSPIQVVAGPGSWISAAAGVSNSVGISSDRTLWVWGSNTYGQLGIPGSGVASTPMQHTDLGPWKQAACGYNTMAAIKQEGTLWMWGQNTNGIWGANYSAGTYASTLTQTICAGTNWSQVSLGVDGVAAVKTDGTLWHWGGYLGSTVGLGADPTPILLTAQSSPIQTIAAGTTWVKVVCGSTHFAAIREESDW